MSIFDAIILGVVQGLTEFLPVSSSGHLVLAQNLLGWTGPNLTFDVALHFATTIAVVIFFRQQLLKLNRRLAILLVIGTVPAGLVGLFFKDSIETLFDNSLLVSAALVMTGVMNLKANTELKDERERKSLIDLSIKDALVVGVFQAVAITPGISRSGSTVFGGLVRKLNREAAFTLSFLLAIPAVLGATLLELIDVYQTGTNGLEPLPLILGGIVAFATGLASLKLLQYVIQKAKFNWFGWYCLVVGAISGLIILL